MRDGERHPPTDAHELMRLLAITPEHEHRLVEWLQDKYAEVYREGHYNGRLDKVVGAEPPFGNPYR